MSESYTQTCASYYGGPSDRATACKVCRRSAGPDLWCRRCRAGEIQYGEGFMERGERAARVYREARRVLEGMHPYSVTTTARPRRHALPTALCAVTGSRLKGSK